MKKLFLLCLAFMLTGIFTNKLTAQESTDTHRIIHVKFNAEQVREGMNIAKKYCKAYADAGHSPIVLAFDGDDRKWDGIFILPLSAGLPEGDQPHPKVVMEQLTKMLGEEVDLVKLHEDFTKMIATLNIDAVRQEAF